jgi:hypothetical protein
VDSFPFGVGFLSKNSDCSPVCRLGGGKESAASCNLRARKKKTGTKSYTELLYIFSRRLRQEADLHKLRFAGDKTLVACYARQITQRKYLLLLTTAISTNTHSPAHICGIWRGKACDINPLIKRQRYLY